MSAASAKALRFPALRGACALLGLVGLFLQASSGGHMLLVEHTKCAEHGELIHGAQEHTAYAKTTETRTLLHGAPSSRSEAAHDHCLLAAERRDATGPVVDAQDTGVVGIEVSRLVYSLDRLCVENGPRFRVAPKNSPPV